MSQAVISPALMIGRAMPMPRLTCPFCHQGVSGSLSATSSAMYAFSSGGSSWKPTASPTVPSPASWGIWSVGSAMPITGQCARRWKSCCVRCSGSHCGHECERQRDSWESSRLPRWTCCTASDSCAPRGFRLGPRPEVEARFRQLLRSSLQKNYGLCRIDAVAVAQCVLRHTRNMGYQKLHWVLMGMLEFASQGLYWDWFCTYRLPPTHAGKGQQSTANGRAGLNGAGENGRARPARESSNTGDPDTSL